MLRAVSEAVTQGIRISVKSKYLPTQSAPSEGRLAFAYTVRITNESNQTVQLRARHWIITDADNTVREVKGDGVVGEQPVLAPGQSFQYTSGCILSTQWGTMHGTYRFQRDNGDSFDAVIAPFLLASPSIETARHVN